MSSVGINIGEIVKPLILGAVLKGQDIEPIIEALINEKITSSILNKVLTGIPEEYKDIADILKMAAELDSLKAAMALMRGETYTPKFSIDKIIELMVTLKLMSALEAALGGSQTTSGG